MKSRTEYQRAGKKRKGEILDSICQAIGLSRDRAARLLRQRSHRKMSCKQECRGRKPQYHEEAVRKQLECLWVMIDYVCGKRMAAGIPTLIDALRRHGEADETHWVFQKILAMSPATIDRVLKQIREKTELRGRSTTKPGSMRKIDIPIRLGNEWDENMPGYVEVDLVAHCGETAAGEYVNTLVMTDIFSGWTESEAVINKAQKHVFQGIKNIRQRLPFPLLGIDSDNGSEFINAELNRYCISEKIKFTRSRPYRKNDNCHIEQKNYTVVRKQLGYCRFEGQEITDLQNAFYLNYRLLCNFFLPSVKLISKTRINSRVIKKYDMPLSPYQRLMACDSLSDNQKRHLSDMFYKLNPITIKRDIIALQGRIREMALLAKERSSRLSPTSHF